MAGKGSSARTERSILTSMWEREASRQAGGSLAPNAGLTGSSFRPGRRQRAAASLWAAPGLLTGESLAGVSPARGPSRASERGLSALQDLKYSLADTLPIPGETAASESQFPR